MDLVILPVLFMFVVTCIAIFKFYSIRKINDEYHKRFSAVFDIEAAVEEAEKRKKGFESKISTLQASYKEKRTVFDKLVETAAIYDETIELAELGFYSPHFDFDTSEEFKQEIALTKSSQKVMVQEKSAVTCSTEWNIDGSKANDDG